MIYVNTETIVIVWCSAAVMVLYRSLRELPKHPRCDLVNQSLPLVGTQGLVLRDHPRSQYHSGKETLRSRERGQSVPQISRA
jgi:hypothetical protein